MTMNHSGAVRSETRRHPLVSVVIIGRNEGRRLERCIASVQAVQKTHFDTEVIYVDSASTDGSPGRAESMGARVITVHPSRPSAALGRNAGWFAASGEFVLFLDGDTVLHPEFVRRALRSMRDERVAIVWGHRRELHPEHSVYNRVLDLDWIYPPGPSEFCGGDALMRRSALAAVGGFDASLIAGEEPEMCRRMREKGFAIEHIDAPMTGHDLAITRFSAYWKRAHRAGHAYAEVARRFQDSPDPMWQREARRNRWHAGALVGACAGLALAPWVPAIAAGAASALLLLVARTYRRCAWKTPSRMTRLLYSVHAHLQQVPIALGQLSYGLNARCGRYSQLIEYKDVDPAA